MSRPSPHNSRRASANAEDFHRAFVKRVHQLIKLGFERMDAPAYRAEEEPAISGDLAAAIEGVLDDPGSEDWMRFYHVHDDPPVNEPKGARKKGRRLRKGKRRRRVDVRIDCSEWRPRTRFCFEAKRLDAGHSAKDYLGHHGLGRFLRGEYAWSEDEAGMLGYVQVGEPGDWACRIGTVLNESPDAYGICFDSPWRTCRIVVGLHHTYRSGHDRQDPRRRIEIYHTLLTFR